MDSLLAIAVGVGLRLLVDAVSQHDFRVAGSLVGLWEGVVLYHFLEKSPRSRDPYLAYGVRLFIDFLVTESLYKTALVVLWTGLGLVLSDIAPFFWYDIGFRHVIRRFRRDMSSLGVTAFPFFYKFSSSPSRVRFHSPPPRIVVQEPQFEVPPSPTAPSVSMSVSSSASTVTQAITLPRVRSSRIPGSFPDDWSEVSRADSETRSQRHDYTDTEDSTSSVMDPDNNTETDGSDSTSDMDPSAANPPDMPEEHDYAPEPPEDNDRTPTTRDIPLPEDLAQESQKPDDGQDPPPNTEFPDIPDGFGAEEENVVPRDDNLFRPDASNTPPAQDWGLHAPPVDILDGDTHPDHDYVHVEYSSTASSEHFHGHADGSSLPPALPPKDWQSSGSSSSSPHLTSGHPPESHASGEFGSGSAFLHNENAQPDSEAQTGPVNEVSEEQSGVEAQQDEQQGPPVDGPDAHQEQGPLPQTDDPPAPPVPPPKPQEQQLDVRNQDTNDAIQQLKDALVHAEHEIIPTKLRVRYGMPNKGRTKTEISQLLKTRRLDYKETSNIFDIAIRPVSVAESGASS